MTLDVGTETSLRNQVARVALAVIMVAGTLMLADPANASDSSAEISGECRVGDDRVFFQAGGTLIPRRGRLTARLLTPNGTVIAKRTDTKLSDHDVFRVEGRISGCRVGKERVKFWSRGPSDGDPGHSAPALLPDSNRNHPEGRGAEDQGHDVDHGTGRPLLGGAGQSQASERIRKYWARGRLRGSSGVATSYYYCTAG